MSPHTLFACESQPIILEGLRRVVESSDEFLLPLPVHLLCNFDIRVVLCEHIDITFDDTHPSVTQLPLNIALGDHAFVDRKWYTTTVSTVQ